jgi:hypothetical protein
MLRYLLRTLILSAWLPAAGCNHLFYYPDHVDYLQPETFGMRAEQISLPSGDETIHMWKIPGMRREKPGKVLHFHGNAQNLSSHFLFSAWLARFGYDVYIFDYRGYGKSTGEPSRAGLVEDGITALKYVAGVDGKELFVLAQSLGGAVAVPSLALAGTAADAVRLLTIDSSFPSYRDMARDKLASFWATWPLQWPLSFLVSEDYSPASYIGRLKMPLLIVHGTKDRIVPFRMGAELFRLAPGPDKTFWKIPDAPHTWFLTEASDWHLRYLDFMCGKHSSPVRCRQDLATAKIQVDRELEELRNKIRSQD